MASSPILRLAVVTLAAALFLLLTPTLIEARPQRKLCGPKVEAIDWSCGGPNVSLDLEHDCSVKQGKKVFDYVQKKLVGEGWPALTTSRVMQEYVRAYVAIKLRQKICVWYNHQCNQQCPRNGASCVTSCLSNFRGCKSSDPTDCCKPKPRCNHTAPASGRRLLQENDSNNNANIKTVQVTKTGTTSDGDMLAAIAEKMGNAGIEKGQACAACLTNTIPGGGDNPKRRMTCSAAGGEGPADNSQADPGASASPIP
ncbi:hypothetical protein CBR_g74664 [Chara braunii]|uniref:Gnk2-homologous domain-containing protein n=1 Tax=Chara braunii TaxID=69332 RepID=A0A388KA88_CHABU|nr:hypothetical protein CBR_g74664 [Chara braunii]|eukprot:GBG66978.1 hypothetical protein CBR_g74664 [Chara braunii]